MDTTPETVNQYVEQIEKEIPFFNVTVNLDNPAIFEALQSSPEDRTKWTKDKLVQTAYELTKYGVYLNSCVNKHVTKIKWCEFHLSNLHGKYANDYGTQFTNYELRIKSLEADNEKCGVLKRCIMKFESEMREIKSLCYAIKDLSNTLIEMSKVR